MEKINIAFIITKLEFGGAQKSVIHTAANLDKAYFNTHLLCGKGGHLDSYAQENVPNLTFVAGLKRKISPVKDYIALIAVIGLLKNIKPDIVHTHSSKAGILGRVAAAFLKRTYRPCRKLKIVHTVHGFSFNDYQNRLVRGLYKRLEKFCNKLSDIVIFVSQENMDRAIKLNLVDHKKCRLVRAGVELKNKADFSTEDAKNKRKELGLKDTDKVVLSIANLKPQKNPFDMIKAAQIVCKEIPDTVFLYTGEGSLHKKADDLIQKLNLQNNFRLLGWRTDSDELLNIADVFCLSSLWEGLPMALVEALSMNVPCVCYDTDGISEVLKDNTNGYLVKKKDYITLAERILKVLKGQLNFTHLNLSDFDVKEMVNKQAGIYIDLKGAEKTK